MRYRDVMGTFILQLDELGPEYGCHGAQRHEDQCHNGDCLHALTLRLHDPTITLCNYVK